MAVGLLFRNLILTIGAVTMISSTLSLAAQGPALTRLQKGWVIRSSADVKEPGSVVSTRAYKPAGWFATTVPSTVVAALVRNEIYPDPHFGMNLRRFPGVRYPIGTNFSNQPMPDDSPFRQSWWYRTEFAPPAARPNGITWLHFDGINFRANIWLNGAQIADAKDVAGSFRVYQFDVTRQILKDGPNVLAVEVFPPLPSDLGITFVDWNPAPPDKMMGLYRDVYLTTTGPVSIRYPQVQSTLDTPAVDKAELKVTAEVRNAVDRVVKGTLKGRIDTIEFSQPVELAPRETKTISFSVADFPQLRISKPRIWWPAPLGDQPLYTLMTEFSEGSTLSDRQRTRFGIRQVTSEMTENGHTVFRINGQRILIRGAGYTPEMLLRGTPERQEAEIRYVKHMNLNTIRLEGKLEDDHFLDYCDEQGVLLMPGWCCCDHWEKWQDWDEEDHRVSVESLKSQILRLRSHPSVFVWLNGSDGPPPAKVEKAYLDVLKELEWPNPVLSSATEKKAEYSGASGVKMRGPYEYVPPIYWLTDKARGGAFGFATEIGPGPAVPPVESIRRMIPPEHLWPIDEYWNFHCGGGAFKTLNVFTEALGNRYGTARDLEDYAKKSQAMAYEAHRAMFEGYGRNKYVSTGVIQWMQNNAWPSMIWHLYDFFLRPAGSYFGSRLACEPLHIQYSYDDRSVVVVNSLYKPFKDLTATIRLFDFSLQERFAKSMPVEVNADGVARVLQIPDLADLSTTYFLKLELADATGRVISRNFYWLSTKPDVLDDSKAKWYYTPLSSFADFTSLQEMPEVRLKGAVQYRTTGQDQQARVMISNPGNSLAFMVRLQILAGKDGEEILPVLWDDNYFSLLPGEKREVTASYRLPGTSGANPSLVVSGWNIKREVVLAGR